MGTECSFIAFPLGDVRRNAAGRIDAAGLIPERNFDRKIRVEAIGMWSEFFVFNRTVLLEHFDIVGAEGIGDVARKDLVIGTTEDLAGVEFEQRLEAAV